MRMRFAAAAFSVLASLAVWAFSLAVLQNQTESALAALTHPPYTPVAEDWSYTPRDIRHAALLVGVAGLLLVTHRWGRCLGLGLLWLTLDVLLDRLDAGLLLASAAAIALALACWLSTRRLSTVEPGERGSLLTYCMFLLAFLAGAGVIASIAAGSYTMPAALVTGRLYAGGVLTALATLMAGTFALEISGRLTRTRYLVTSAVAAMLAFAFTALPFTLYTGADLYVWSLAATALIIAGCVATTRLVRTTGRALVLIVMTPVAFACYAGCALVLLFTGSPVAEALTAAALSPPVHGADMDVLLTMSVLVAALPAALFLTAAATAFTPQERKLAPAQAS
jgi:hypothetical protein